MKISLKKIEETGFHIQPNLSPETNIKWYLAVKMIVPAVGDEFSIEMFSSARKDGSNYHLAGSSAVLTFEVKGLDSVVFRRGSSKVRMDEELVVITLNVAVNTLRGIMAARFKDTVLEDKPLPLCDPWTLMENIEIKS